MSSEVFPPPPPLSEPSPQSVVRRGVAGFLSVALGVWLANAVLSLASDSMVVWLANDSLVGWLGWVAVPALLMAVVVYGLMGLTRMVPKRFFLPLVLCGPLTALAALPVMIYFHRESAWISWGMSAVQALVCVVVIYRLRGARGVEWPFFRVEQLEARGFTWGNTLGFAAVNALVLVPAAAVYLISCGGLAVDHFTGGFVALRPAGVTMQVRKYVREDGKTVELVPMSHIGEAEFYQTLAASFSPTAAVLMEGVSDREHLLTEKVGYGKTARDLGLAEQQAAFKPKGELVPADVDISEFSKVTLECLKRTMVVHAQGINAATLPVLMQPAPEDLPEKLMEDLLEKRNAHVLGVLEERLRTTDHVIIPWGAAHMPGISAGVLKAGFRLLATEDHVAIRFGEARGGSNDGLPGHRRPDS